MVNIIEQGEEIQCKGTVDPSFSLGGDAFGTTTPTQTVLDDNFSNVQGYWRFWADPLEFQEFKQILKFSSKKQFLPKKTILFLPKPTTEASWCGPQRYQRTPHFAKWN